MVLSTGKSFEEISSTYTIRQLHSLRIYKNWKLKQNTRNDTRLAHVLEAIYRNGGAKNVKLKDCLINWKPKKNKVKKSTDPERNMRIWMNWLGIKEDKDGKWIGKTDNRGGNNKS